MTEADFHRALAALNPPEGVPELAELLLVALRQGHALEQHPHPELSRSRAAWRCSICRARVVWRPDLDGVAGAAVDSSCAETIRRAAARGLATPDQLAWLAGQPMASAWPGPTRSTPLTAADAEPLHIVGYPPGREVDRG